MSGFTRGQPWTFELTFTKASYWHRVHAPDPCWCRDPDRLHALAQSVLVPAGFEVVAEHGSWLGLNGPGLDEASTDELWAAISGL